AGEVDAPARLLQPHFGAVPREPRQHPDREQRGDEELPEGGAEKTHAEPRLYMRKQGSWEGPYFFCASAARNSLIIGTSTPALSISVTCVVFGNTASLDSERGRRSPWISPPFRRNISAMWSSRTPSASPWMKKNGA